MLSGTATATAVDTLDNAFKMKITTSLNLPQTKMIE